MMTHPTEQYDRARQLLLALWPHTWAPLNDERLTIIAEIMVNFARMEARRATRELSE